MGSDERRSPRGNVILTATVEQGSARIRVRVGDLSQHGALIIGGPLLVSEKQIVFCCNGVAIKGWVAWSKGDRAGIEFGAPIEPEAFTQRVERPRPEIIKDSRESDFRRPGFRGNLLTKEQRDIVVEHNRPSQKLSKGEGLPTELQGEGPD